MDTLYLVVAIGVIGYFIRYLRRELLSRDWNVTSGAVRLAIEFIPYSFKTMAVMASVIYVMYFFLPKESDVDRQVREMEEEMAATLKFLGVEEATDADNK